MTNNNKKVPNTYMKTSFFNYFKMNKNTINSSKNINGNYNGNNVDNSSVNVSNSKAIKY